MNDSTTRPAIDLNALYGLADRVREEARLAASLRAALDLRYVGVIEAMAARDMSVSEGTLECGRLDHLLRGLDPTGAGQAPSYSEELEGILGSEAAPLVEWPPTEHLQE